MPAANKPRKRRSGILPIIPRECCRNSCHLTYSPGKFPLPTCSFALLVLCVSGCSVLNGNSNSGNGSGSAGNPSPPPPATLSNSVNHIVFLAQENRSFDHYFGALREYWAKNGYPDQSFDGLPQFNPASGASPLNAPARKNPGCDPTVPAPADCVFDASNPVTSFHLVTQCAENPSLTKRDATQMDMTEFFDFSNPPGRRLRNRQPS